MLFPVLTKNSNLNKQIHEGCTASPFRSSFFQFIQKIRRTKRKNDILILVLHLRVNYCSFVIETKFWLQISQVVENFWIILSIHWPWSIEQLAFCNGLAALYCVYNVQFVPYVYLMPITQWLDSSRSTMTNTHRETGCLNNLVISHLSSRNID